MEKNDLNPQPTEETLHEQTSEIADSARKTISDLDKDFNSKIDDIGHRVKSARGRAEKLKPEANNASGMTPEDAKGLGTGLTAAYALIGTPIILYLIGLAIDGALHRGPNDVHFAAFFGFAGFVIGLVFTITIANRNSK